MKQIFSISLASIFLTACIVFSPFFHLTNLNGNHSSEGFDADVSAREQWEFMRLRAPKTGKIPAHIRQMEAEFAKNLPVRFENHAKVNSIQGVEDWISRGPWNVGGRTRALGIDVGNPNIYLAGGVSSGIFRSADGGSSWSNTFSPDQFHSTSCLVQDTRIGKQNVWYCGTGEPYGFSQEVYGDGILKSTDGGKSWQKLPSTSTGTPLVFDGAFEFVWNVATNPANSSQDEVLAATTYGGIWRSVNGGTSWNPVLGGLGNSYSGFTDIAISTKGVYYAALSQASGQSGNSIKQGIYRSTNGVNWTNISPPDLPVKYNRVVIGISPSDENQVWFLASTPGTGHKSIDFLGNEDWNSLWKYRFVANDGSGNGGVWENHSSNMPKFGGLLGGDFTSQGSYDLVVKVKPNDTNTVFIGGSNLFRSTDGFTSTQNISWIGGYKPNTVLPFYEVYPNNHPDEHALVFNPANPNVMINGNDGGIWQTSDNSSSNVAWNSMNNGYLTTQFYTIALDHSQKNDVLIGGLQDNGSLFTNSVLSQKNWVAPGLGDGSYCAISSSGTHYMSRQSGKIWQYKFDSSGNILQQGRIDPPLGDGLLFINPFILDPKDNNVMFVAGGHYLLRNNDLSAVPFGNYDTAATTTKNWEYLPKIYIANGVISFLACGMDRNLYFGTTLGQVFRLDSAYSGSRSPVEVTGVDFPKNSYVSSIAIDPTDNRNVLVVFSNYGVMSLFYSTDAGASWTAMGGNLEQSLDGSGSGPSCRTAQIVPVSGGTMYFVGTSIGLYSTSFLNGSNTVWEQEGASSIGRSIIEFLDSRTSDGLLVAATHGNGVFSRYVLSLPAKAVVSLRLPADKSRGIKLAQNFSWNVGSGLGTLLYHIQISDKTDFSTLFLDQAGIFSNSIDVNDLPQGKQTMYWRVQAFNSAGSGDFTPIWSFNTAINLPNLLTPFNNATNSPTNPTLSWNSVAGATFYHLQVGVGISFANPVADTVIKDTMFSLANLTKQKKYSWRVTTVDADGESEYSSRWNFTTGDLSGVAEDISDNRTVLSQNFPNPTSDQTTFNFSISDEKYVKISLFDSRGKRISILKNGNFSSGTHSVQIDVGNLANGVYFYKMESGKAVLTRRLTVQK